MQKFLGRVLAKIDKIRSLVIIRTERLFRKNELCKCEEVTISLPTGEKITFFPYTARVWYFFRARRSSGLRLSGIMDPINLVFVGGNADNVRTVLENAGWNVGSGGAQYTCIEGRVLFPVFDMEFVPATNPDERFHVRLYETTASGISWVIAAAHHEYYDRHEENHIVSSWENAEKRVTRAFRLFPQYASGQINEVDYHGKPSDGKATIIDIRGSPS